ncbi:MAG: hypothetical protein ACM3PW_09030 [Chlamydiota bacterium]
MFRNLAIMAFGILLAGTVLAPQALANTGNKRMTLTINHPVEIPGCVLTPGRYDLQLMHFGGNVAGVWNASGNHFYGMIPTTPVSRVRGINHTRVDLSKPQDGIARIKDFFYPGDDYGYRFVYPSSQKQLAKRTVPANQNNG